MIIGITGGIGVGKSTVANLLKEKGATVIDADKIGWEILNQKKEQLVEVFGRQILNKANQIDRKKLGKIVFEDHNKRKTLESLVHPLLLRELKKRIAKEGSKLIVVDCALIYEWGIQDWFDFIILVKSNLKTRVERLKEKGYSLEEIKRRMKAQLPNCEKSASFVIENEGSLARLRLRVEQIWEKIQLHMNSFGKSY
ncbi:MAG TPA: dephospho-CoA kinase [bacterium (Candidatus Stahlbacteria)]|nr:dephospho-CoA kinase [Candidatus Stahlbacteria bacterium]